MKECTPDVTFVPIRNPCMFKCIHTSVKNGKGFVLLTAYIVHPLTYITSSLIVTIVWLLKWHIMHPS